MTTPPPAVTNPAQLFDLTGRTALITGGSRGLGKEMALAFAHQGADIMIASRSIESCEETAAEVRRETGRNCVPYACHIGRWDELEGLADAVWNEFEGLDILVNNAGITCFLYGDCYVAPTGAIEGGVKVKYSLFAAAG